MPQIFKIGSYWVYFWTNDWSQYTFMYPKAVPLPILLKFGLRKLENVICAIIIPRSRNTRYAISCECWKLATTKLKKNGLNILVKSVISARFFQS